MLCLSIEQKVCEIMSGFKIIISLALSTGLVLTGCAHMPQNAPVQHKYNYQLNQQCPVDLTVAVGETIQFVADDNPSTGYSWRLATALQHLEATSTYKADKTEGYLIVGAGGVRTFHFKALSAGTETIQLVYNRSWSPQEIGAQWNCQVTVK